MSKIRPPVKASVAALAAFVAITALALLFGMTFAGTLDSDGAAAAAQAATAMPRGPLTATLSADPANDRTFATVNLHAGYIMDPYLLPVVGKGETAASSVQKDCNGYVSTSPDVVVNWSGKGDLLSFFVYGDSDAVLAIQQPDGSFVCNDDAGRRTTGPLVRFANPSPGVYRVHAGTARKDEPALGFLAVTQMDFDDEKLSQLDLSPLLHRRESPRTRILEQLDPSLLLAARAPVFGSAELQPGFETLKTFAAGGGDISAVRVEDQSLTCAGFVSAVPSYRFTWTGKQQGLRLFFESLKDSSLAVLAPDQKVLCNMNSDPGNLNPLIEIAAAMEGDYRVYVASMEPKDVVMGRLTITGDLKTTPSNLTPARVGQ